MHGGFQAGRGSTKLGAEIGKLTLWRSIQCFGERWFVVAALLLLPSAVHAQSIAQSVDVALAALKRGDHATALKVLPPLAEQGNAAAQFNLGLIYDNGRGVALNHAEALKWYRLAAVQGNAGAQRHLGELYYDGLGVTQDTARAYLWLHLAAGAGDARAARYRDLAARHLKPPQVAEAQKEARACQLNAFAGCD
jgi:TPR repeat protein